MWPLKIALEVFGGLLGSAGRILSLAGIAAAVLSAVFFAGIEYGQSQAEQKFAQAQHEAELAAARRVAEINAQSMQDQLELAARERRLNARYKALQETINQEEFEGCTVPADVVERLNALDF